MSKYKSLFCSKYNNHLEKKPQKTKMAERKNYKVFVQVFTTNAKLKSIGNSISCLWLHVVMEKNIVTCRRVIWPFQNNYLYR